MSSVLKATLKTRSSANPEEPCEHTVSWNRVKCCTSVRRIAYEKACNQWMTLKVIRGYCRCCHSIGHTHFLFVFYCKYICVLHRFRDINTYLPINEKVTWPWPRPSRGQNCFKTLPTSDISYRFWKSDIDPALQELYKGYHVTLFVNNPGRVAMQDRSRPVSSSASVIGWETRPVLIFETGLGFATRPRWQDTWMMSSIISIWTT